MLSDIAHGNTYTLTELHISFSHQTFRSSLWRNHELEKVQRAAIRFLWWHSIASHGRHCCWFPRPRTVYPKKYAHGFVVLCFVVVMQSFIMNSHEVFIHIHQGCFAGTGAIVWLPQCQWSKPDGYGKISQCITTTKHSKAKTVCIFLGIYCISLTEHVQSVKSSWNNLRQVSKCLITFISLVTPCIPSFLQIPE